MDFDAGEIGGAAGQPVRRGAVVADLEIAGADFGALRRRARPGLFDRQVARLDVLGEGGGGAEGERERQTDGMEAIHLRLLVGFVCEGKPRQGFTVKSKLPCVLWVSTDTACQVTV